MTSEALLVDVREDRVICNAEKSDKYVKSRGRNNFYSLPKTLSEDDDPFGLFQGQGQGGSSKKQQVSVSDEMINCETLIEKEEPSTGLLVQIETDSPKITISESFNSVSSRTSATGFLAVSGLSMSSTSGLSVNGGGASSIFGNVSSIHSANSALSDEVFLQDSQLVSSNEDEPNWDKLLNEAQFVALKISDPAVPTKTPLALSKFTSTAKLNNFSPGDMIDSPSGMLLDTSKENPDNFLVQLTPESSPKKIAKTQEQVLAASPTLENKLDKLKISNRPSIEDNNANPNVVEETLIVGGNGSVLDSNAAKDKKATQSPTRGDQRKFSQEKKFTTPVRKGSKENIKPRQLSNTDVKKPSGNTVTNLKSGINKGKGISKPAATDVKKPSTIGRQVQSEVKKRVPLSSNLSSTASANTRKPTAAAKTLFTPKNTVPRVAKRESLSAVKEKTVKPSEEGSQFKLPSKTTDAHLKKTVAPTRTGRLQPTKLSLPPVRPAAGSMNKPGAGTSSLVRPGGPIKASHSANMSLLKANTSGIPKSGLQRPTLLRQGSALCGSMVQRPTLLRQGSALCGSMVGSKLSTPVMSRVRRPSDIGLKSGAATGMCLPSPQVLNKNTSLVCSTPTVGGSKQSTNSVLPSPITSIKRKV